MTLRRQIRRYAREMLAAIGLIGIGTVTAVLILGNQNFHWPWESFYEVKAEFSSAQAVTPGQGQQVTVSGVKVGDVAGVDLEDGHAVVTLDIESKYAPIYNDAHMLLRPRTGLKDMEVVLDPGTKASGEVPSGGTLQEANTQPDVNPDEVLGALDTDTRRYLASAVDALGTGIGPNGGSLRKLLIASEPTATDARRLTATLATRRDQISHLVHNLNLIATEAGNREGDVRRTIRYSSEALGALAQHDDAIRGSLTRLPGTLDAASSALRDARPLATELKPAATQLTPAVRRVTVALPRVRPLVREATPIIRDRLRPFVRSAVPALQNLAPAADALQKTSTDLPAIVQRGNYIVNEALYNPPGSEEGYGFWVPWFFHDAASMLSTQDAHGAEWRGLALFSCSTLQQLTTFIPHSGAPLQLPQPKALGC
ncbi:MAG TPA: MlaD family protein [Solirubrobacterales bacterium]|nr:MlaD family protein [Solirubrobacterales bacterium]